VGADVAVRLLGPRTQLTHLAQDRDRPARAVPPDVHQHLEGNADGVGVGVVAVVHDQQAVCTLTRLHPVCGRGDRREPLRDRVERFSDREGHRRCGGRVADVVGPDERQSDVCGRPGVRQLERCPAPGVEAHTPPRHVTCATVGHHSRNRARSHRRGARVVGVEDGDAR
jgi:hypothetical protein